MVGGGGEFWRGDVCERACFFAVSDSDKVLVDNWNLYRVDVENGICEKMNGPEINQNFVVFQPRVIARSDGLNLIGIVQATIEKCRTALIGYN